MSELSLEELLARVEEAERRQSRKVANKDDNSVDRFILDMKVKTGLERIPTHVIYYTYKKKWYNKSKDKKSNKIVFFSCIAGDSNSESPCQGVVTFFLFLISFFKSNKSFSKSSHSHKVFFINLIAPLRYG